MKKWLTTCSALLLSTTILFEGVVAATPLDEVRQIVAESYVDAVPRSVLALSTPQDILAKLDRYSTYFTATEYTDFIGSIEGTTKGIGILYTMTASGAKVDSVLKFSPAEAAGLQKDDIIETVNGEAVGGKSSDYFRSLVRKYGTELKLGILRQGSNLVISTAVGEIKVPTVEGKKLAGNIGYIHLNSFDQKAAEEISDVAQTLVPVNGWVFDLRDNGGGYVTAAADVAKLFPKIENATVFKYRNSKEYLPVRDKQDDSSNALFAKQTAVLINGNSASASEMVAGAVKDYKVARLVGQRSYGKGSMQTMFTLSNKDVLKLTIARFYSPLTETTIHEVGVKPDVTTPIGQEVTVAHEELLKRITLKNYAALPATRVKVTSQKVAVTVPNAKAINVTAAAVYELGGAHKAVQAIAINNSKIELTFNKNNKSKYLLVLPAKSATHSGYYVKF